MSSRTDKRPYIEGVSVLQIIEDGWSRDFDPLQTYQEIKDMGFRRVSLPQVKIAFAVHTQYFEKSMGPDSRKHTFEEEFK